ncbi:MAG: SHOCT domain-containing protein [Microbacteriaceae bacterium]
MFTSLALAAAAVHPFGHGFGFLFFLIPLFWILLIVALFAIFGRRRRAMWGAYGHGYGPWAQAHAARSAESTLAERYAQGDIDEKEYRARLEVLRASAPQPPVK